MCIRDSFRWLRDTSACEFDAHLVASGFHVLLVLSLIRLLSDRPLGGVRKESVSYTHLVILLAQVLSDPAYTVDRKRANVIGDWLDSLGVLSAKPHKRRLPKALFHVSKPQIALFISHLWSLSGSASVAKSGDRGRIRMESPSRRLVEDVSRLLLRFGISTTLTVRPAEGGARAAYRLEVAGEDSQRRFLQEIGLHLSLIHL